PGAFEAAEDAHAVDEVIRSYDGALWGYEEMLLDQSLIRAGSPPGWSVA
ncbi:hypothetical protein Tco_0602883, partial [Tanacetum coccineum]